MPNSLPYHKKLKYSGDGNHKNPQVTSNVYERGTVIVDIFPDREQVVITIVPMSLTHTMSAEKYEQMCVEEDGLMKPTTMLLTYLLK